MKNKTRNQTNTKAILTVCEKPGFTKNKLCVTIGSETFLLPISKLNASKFKALGVASQG